MSTNSNNILSFIKAPYDNSFRVETKYFPAREDLPEGITYFGLLRGKEFAFVSFFLGVGFILQSMDQKVISDRDIVSKYSDAIIYGIQTGMIGVLSDEAPPPRMVSDLLYRIAVTDFKHNGRIVLETDLQP